MMDPPLTTIITILTCALLIDYFFGEYWAPLHPVVWIGNVTSVLLKAAPCNGWWLPFLFGIFLVVAVTSLSVALTLAALHLAARRPVLEIVVGTFLLKASFAFRALGAAADQVRAPLEAGDLPRAREALRSLCSRDPSHLEEESLLAATIQSLAENASDSFVAPLFYFSLLGVPGAIAYRAINTLDAMVGYRGPFEALGKASARLDDVANWLPARLSAALLFFAGALLGCDLGRAWRIFRRDATRTPSPNGGRPMAMMAGLLGVRLEKKGVYVLGDPDQIVTPETVRQAWNLIVLTGWLAVGLSFLGIVGLYQLGRLV